MRNELLGFLEQSPDGDAGEERLHPLVLEAVTQNRQRLTPLVRAQ
jgi:formate dehydrogenase subunit delta